jgi:hypothetical protein
MVDEKERLVEGSYRPIEDQSGLGGRGLNNAPRDRLRTCYEEFIAFP